MCPEVLVGLVLSQQDQSGWCFGVCSGQRLCAVSYCPLPGCWEQAGSLCQQQPGQTSLHRITPVLVTTLGDPAWGLQTNAHPVSRDKDMLVPMCTGGTAAWHCQHPHRPGPSCADSSAGSQGLCPPHSPSTFTPPSRRVQDIPAGRWGEPQSLALLQAPSPTQTQVFVGRAKSLSHGFIQTGAKIAVRAMKRVFGAIKLLCLSVLPAPVKLPSHGDKHRCYSKN